jgi:hypothetical protein
LGRMKESVALHCMGWMMMMMMVGVRWPFSTNEAINGPIKEGRPTPTHTYYTPNNNKYFTYAQSHRQTTCPVQCNYRKFAPTTTTPTDHAKLPNSQSTRKQSKIQWNL